MLSLRIKPIFPTPYKFMDEKNAKRKKKQLNVFRDLSNKVLCFECHQEGKQKKILYLWREGRKRLGN